MESKPSAVEQIHAQLDTSVITRGRVVFIGLGGVGKYVSQSAAAFLSGLQGAMPSQETNLLLVDGDEFSISNTYRMDVPEFGNKAEAIGKGLLQSFDVPGFSVRWKPEYVTPDNVAEIIKSGDCVFLCVDNHATRKLVSDHCQTLRDVVLISGGNDGVDEGLRGTYGNVQVYLREEWDDLTAPLTQFHPEIASPQDKAPHEMDCLELAAAGIPQITMVNMTVAAWMVNSLMRLMMPVEGERMWDEVCFDIIEGVSTPQWLSGPQMET